jgi:hypothetical protein
MIRFDRRTVAALIITLTLGAVTLDLLSAYLLSR